VSQVSTILSALHARDGNCHCNWHSAVRLSPRKALLQARWRQLICVQDLSRKLSHDADLFSAVRGLGYVHHVRGDIRQSMREFPEALDLARRTGEPALLVQAYHFAGVSTFHLGAFQTAREWLQRSLEAGDSGGRYHSEVYGINMGVFCHAY